MIEPTRRFQLLKLFRKQDKLFRKAIRRQIFSGCSVAFGDQDSQFFRFFGYVSDRQTCRVGEVADSARAMLQTGQNHQQCDDGCWIWVDAPRQIFAIFVPEPAADRSTEEVWKKFQLLVAEGFARS